jgi:hypothetical protein
MTGNTLEAERQIHLRTYLIENLASLIDEVCGQTGMSKASAVVMVSLATGDIMEAMGGKAALKVIEASAIPRLARNEAKVAAQERRFMAACDAFYKQTDLRAAQAKGSVQ